MRHVRIDPTEGPSTERPADAAGVPVRDRMSWPAITVTADAPLAEALRLMATNRIHYLPVVDGEVHLVGIVNADDVLQTRRARRPPAQVVAAVMSTPVISVGAASPFTDAMGLMADGRIGALPVVEDGRVVGILTQSDIVTAVARQESV